MTHWLLVSSADNFEISRQRGFDMAGIKSRRRKAAQEVATGDSVFFYVTRLKAIAGESVATGPAVEDHEPIWTSSKPDEVYPFRFPTKLVTARDSDNYLDVLSFIDQLEYAKRWPREHWTLAFQGNVHKLGEADYELIHRLLIGGAN